MDSILALIIYVAGYAAIPFISIRLVGALGQLTGWINNKSRGWFDRGRKSLETRRKKRRGESKFRRQIKDEEYRRKGTQPSYRHRILTALDNIGSDKKVKKPKFKTRSKDRRFRQVLKDEWSDFKEDRKLKDLFLRDDLAGVNKAYSDSYQTIKSSLRLRNLAPAQLYDIYANPNESFMSREAALNLVAQARIPTNLTRAALLSSQIDWENGDHIPGRIFGHGFSEIDAKFLVSAPDIARLQFDETGQPLKINALEAFNQSVGDTSKWDLDSWKIVLGDPGLEELKKIYTRESIDALVNDPVFKSDIKDKILEISETPFFSNNLMPDVYKRLKHEAEKIKAARRKTKDQKTPKQKEQKDGQS